MVAFSLWSLHIYRYGIFYLLAFLIGYGFFHFIAVKNVFAKSFPRMQAFLTTYVDDLVLMIFLGVLVWGRLGHVFIYNAPYYLHHLQEIFQVWKWGMSFIGWLIGVTVALLFFVWKHKFTRKEFLLLGDLIFAILPFGIMLGRIGNYLNQELYGIVVPAWVFELPARLFYALWSLNIFHIYPLVDNFLRVNTNFLASFFEGFVLLVITLLMVRRWVVTKKIIPWKIMAVFLLRYSFVRFFLEYLRADSQLEFHGWFTTSQWYFIAFFLLGVIVWISTKMRKANS